MKFIYILFLLLSSNWVLSTHIIGGEIYYENLGNGNYRITLEIYRDCFNGEAGFDNPLQFTIFNGDGTIYNVFNFNTSSITLLPYVSTDPCIIAPTDFCIELGLYSEIINLPDSPTGYTIAYSRCCWSNSILNIQFPDINGITLTSSIPPTTILNSNPRYVNYPPLVLCVNRPYSFNHLAEDLDGDSLAYRIVTPFIGGSFFNPAPDPEVPPPFVENMWQPGFSENVPFGNSSIVQIDPITGILTFEPNLLGNFVLAVEVSEFRNGVLLSTKSRTFGYRVAPCQLIPPVDVAVIGAINQLEDCSSASFVITRLDAGSDLLIELNMTGTATNGVDYNFIPNQTIMGQNVFSDTIDVISSFDNINEGTESVSIDIIIASPCDPTDKDTTLATLYIADYHSLTANYEEYREVCDENPNDYYLLQVGVENGLAPYNYNWNDHAFDDNDTISVPSSFLVPKENIFNLVITDQCSKSLTLNPIILDNQCPLITPNIITTNLDGINEKFIIKNLEDFDQVELIILNRWGNIVYETVNYQNNWSGVDQKGNYLSNGVYFYKIIPHDDEYEYNEIEKLKFMIQGIVHLVHDEN